MSDGGTSTIRTAGRLDRSATSGGAACPVHGPVAWWRRALLTVALVFGAWTLLAAWAAAAHADSVEPEPCPAVDVQSPLVPPPEDPAPAETSLEDVLLAPQTCDADPTADVPPAPEAVVVPPPPDDPEVPVADAPVVTPDETVVVLDHDDAVPTGSPEDAGPAPEAPPADSPAALPDIEALETDVAVVEPAPMESPAVSPPLADEVACPVPCGEPASADVVVKDVRDSPHGASRSDGPPRPGTGSMTTDSAPAPASVQESGTPAVPATPTAPVLPAPVHAPVPAGPAGPAGSSATASTCTSSAGPGQHDPADSIDAVLDARVAASLAQAALRATSGFAGAVGGGADNPGVRPG